MALEKAAEKSGDTSMAAHSERSKKQTPAAPQPTARAKPAPTLDQRLEIAQQVLFDLTAAGMPVSALDAPASGGVILVLHGCQYCQAHKRLHTGTCAACREAINATP